MRIATLMTSRLVTAGSHTDLDEALALMDRHHVRHLPIVDGERLVGMVSDRDLLLATGGLPARIHEMRESPCAGRRDRRLGDLMSAPVHTTRPDADLVDAGLELLGRGIGSLPVLEDERLVGIVTDDDLAGALLAACERPAPPPELDPPVAIVMTRDPVCLERETTLAAARRLLQRTEAHHLPVLEGGRLAGLVTDRDLRRAAGRGLDEERWVEIVMSTPAVATTPTTPLSACTRRMRTAEIGCLPVVADDQVVGILTTSDVVSHLVSALRRHPGAFAPS